MGMSIDEAKEWLVSRKEHYEMDDDCQELAQSLSVAINSMRKYQKIEQIVNNYISSGKPYISVIDEDIRKVLEDGKID